MKKIKKIIVKLNLVNIISIFFYIFRIFPINNKKVIVVNYHGKGYGDSGKYIVEKLLNEKDIIIFWALNDLNDEVPNKVKKVKFNSILYFFHLSTAKVWVNNARFPQFIRKRKNQYYIQTWHGCLALKKIEFDAYEKMTEYYKKWMIRDTKMTNLMISNSDFCNEMYKRAFRYDGEILKVGCPRNDILVSDNSKIRNKVYNYFKINKSEKILLYAPTFRNDFSNYPYDLNFNKIKKVLENNTGYKWKIMIRLHPIIKNSEKLIENMNDFINANNYHDMQELIIACDLLITDYSSTMFEAMISNKKVFLYIKDLEDYNDERGTYFDIKKLPFEYAKSSNDMIEKLKNINYINFEKKYKEFNKKIGLNETGTASQCVANRIISVMNGDKNE